MKDIFTRSKCRNGFIVGYILGILTMTLVSCTVPIEDRIFQCYETEVVDGTYVNSNGDTFIFTGNRVAINDWTPIRWDLWVNEYGGCMINVWERYSFTENFTFAVIYEPYSIIVDGDQFILQ